MFPGGIMSYQRYSSVNETSIPSLFEAMEKTINQPTTINGCPTNETSDDVLLDLFFQIGTYRNQDDKVVIENFVKAFEHDSNLALRILFWNRDVRGGQGERKVFRTCMKFLANEGIDLSNVIPHIPFYGRWDDLLIFIDTPMQEAALNIIALGLEDRSALCAKWMPREKSSKAREALILRKHLGLTPKAYRKLLSSLTNVVESQMCKKEWDSITFSKVPSRAALIYRKAFEKNTPKLYNDYLLAVLSGEEKVNSSTLYPYDLTSKVVDFSYRGMNPITLTEAEQMLIDEQWKALPNYMEGSSDLILPIIDTSGSMYTEGKPSPIEAAISLGMYIAERNEGPFKNQFLTFSQQPEIVNIEGSNLSEKVGNISRAAWAMNTDLEAVFRLVLESAVTHKLPQSEMPTMILILSDMEFDIGSNPNMTAYQNAAEMYKQAGYELPKIVFWNLNTLSNNFPVKSDSQGNAMVSGFSPSILKQILSGQDLSPMSIMLSVINSQRYKSSISL